MPVCKSHHLWYICQLNYIVEFFWRTSGCWKKAKKGIVLVCWMLSYHCGTLLHNLEKSSWSAPYRNNESREVCSSVQWCLTENLAKGMYCVRDVFLSVCQGNILFRILNCMQKTILPLLFSKAQENWPLLKEMYNLTCSYKRRQHFSSAGGELWFFPYYMQFLRNGQCWSGGPSANITVFIEVRCIKSPKAKYTYFVI